MSIFSGGGGSSLGYKLAGIDVIANCEIDAKQNELYLANCHPTYTYQMDVRDLIQKAKTKDLPDELYNLDILDGSPPCTLFSSSNLHAKKYKGIKRKFREGQKAQILDDLFIEFIRLADELKPKIIIAENVKGLLHKKNESYVLDIMKKFEQIGYKATYKLLNASNMGVPQNRHRVFFIAIKNTITTQSSDLFDNLLRLNLDFKHKKIPIAQLDKGLKIKTLYPCIKKVIKNYEVGDTMCSDITLRTHKKKMYFNYKITTPQQVMPTIVANFDNINIVLVDDGYRNVSYLEIIQAQTFPMDYNFLGQKIGYTIGMSVPPLMIYHLINKVLEQIKI